MVKNGVVTTVQGSYTYFHYGHDGTDDAGWGCAYRSLQTLISWYIKQHYTSLEKVPTILEIQKMLELIDYSKQGKGFAGSKVYSRLCVISQALLIICFVNEWVPLQFLAIPRYIGHLRISTSREPVRSNQNLVFRMRSPAIENYSSRGQELYW